MGKGYIEVSENLTLENYSRPDSTLKTSRNMVESNVRVTEAVGLITEYGVSFSHYVKSVRLGRIAVYIRDTDNEHISLRLKQFSKRKLKKIKIMTQGMDIK